MSEIELVRKREGALCHREIIYRVKKIGLSFSVVAAYAVHVRRELQFLEDYVPEIRNDYFLKNGHRLISY